MTTPIPPGFRSLPISLVQLSLAAVLNCGQSFRWTTHPLPVVVGSDVHAFPTHEYRLCLRDRVVCLRQSPEALLYRSVFPEGHLSPTQEAVREAETLAWLKDYFQLDVDLVKLYDEWSSRDTVFRALRSRFPGIRMLRQDPWENLVSFICSSNNNIARITKMIHALCKHCSPPLLSLVPPESASDTSPESVTYYPFPAPSMLAASEIASKLRALGFGYRADFIQRTAQMLVDEHKEQNVTDTSAHDLEGPEKWLMTLRGTDTLRAREELLRFVGVGRKVADCILLMSLDKREVIPVDTHVHQIAMKHYGLRGSCGSNGKTAMTPKLYDEINTKLVGIWGDYAGWAHSVLFTADLKVFASYGMSESPLKPEANPAYGSATSPSTSSNKKRPRVKKELDAAAVAKPAESPHSSLAERVKKRRRTITVAA
ncbi:DNA glycosylase [Phlebopus sp. FC_14]|nr:DNA glycosylase [Phlebopus sp. FC_14]